MPRLHRGDGSSSLPRSTKFAKAQDVETPDWRDAARTGLGTGRHHSPDSIAGMEQERLATLITWKSEGDNSLSRNHFMLDRGARSLGNLVRAKSAGDFGEPLIFGCLSSAIREQRGGKCTSTPRRSSV